MAIINNKNYVYIDHKINISAKIIMLMLTIVIIFAIIILISAIIVIIFCFHNNYIGCGLWCPGPSWCLRAVRVSDLRTQSCWPRTGCPWRSKIGQFRDPIPGAPRGRKGRNGKELDASPGPRAALVPQGRPDASRGLGANDLRQSLCSGPSMCQPRVAQPRCPRTGHPRYLYLTIMIICAIIMAP